MRRKWMPFALAAIIAASAAITPVYADDPPSGSLPSSFEGYRPSGSDAAGGVYLMLTEETIQNWTRPRGESPSQTPSSAAVRRGAKRFQNGVEKISTLTEAVEDMTPGSSPYANISPGMEFIDNILTGIGATSEMVKHPGAERIGTAAEVTQGVIQSQPVVDYIAENKHPVIDFMDQMTIDMNWGITELFGGDGDAYIRNIRDNGYESLAGDFNAFDDVQGQNWQDWRIAQLYQRYAELIAAGKEAEAQALLDRLNSMNQDPSSMTPRGVEVKKPNIYLYPEEETEITVTFDRPELLTVSDPLYGDGWTVTAHPDGTLEDAGGKYGFLFYESLADPSIFRLDEGFVVKAEQREQTYRRVLEAYGFNEQEILDFIEYWTDYLEPGVDYVMYPLLTEGVDAEMPVRFSVQPDNIFRLWFGFVRYEGGAVPEPEIVPMDRSGFEAVEWGGAVLN